MLVWSAFFHLPKFLLLSLVFAYIYISEGSVETHLTCGGIYINHIIAAIIVCRVRQWKNLENPSIIGDDIDKSKMPRFLWPMVYLL